MQNLSVTTDQTSITVAFPELSHSPSPDRYQVVFCPGAALGKVLFNEYISGGGLHYAVQYGPGFNPDTQYTVGVRAELSDGSHASPWATATVSTAGLYVNPFSKVTGLVCERVDQGVDFAGAGPVFALGDGTVIETNGPGWPGGPFFSYRLSSGRAAGLCVYVAEDIEILTLDITPNDKAIVQTRKSTRGIKSFAMAYGLVAGSPLKAGQQIGTMFNGDNGIEIGWARADGLLPESQQPEAGSISGANLPLGGTLIGRNMDQLLVSLGIPAANNLTLPPGGLLPAGWPTW
jgi:hypothetical protein